MMKPLWILVVYLNHYAVDGMLTEESNKITNGQNQLDYGEGQDELQSKQQAVGWSDWWSYEGISG